MKRTTKILLALLVLLIVGRLLLPYVVLRYVNKVLADMGSYTGRIEDVNIALLRGAYQIEDLRIRKINGKVKEPFLYIPKADLSIEWKSLFKGELVGEVEAYEPELNFAFSNNESERQTGEEVDWTVLVKDLLPIQINRFAVINGRIDLASLITKPRADLSMQRFNGEIRNIRNVEEVTGKLPSPVWATGDIPGYGGTMRFDANMYLLKPMPDFNYDLRFTNIEMTKLNEMARAYANIDFERGRLNVFSEMAMNDGKLNGYVKPLTKEMKIFKLDENDNRSVGRFFTELLAQGGTALLKNQKLDQVATRIPLSGTVDDVKTGLWPTIFGVLRNAYIQAFKGEFDNDITFKDALSNFREDLKEKRAERKAERKEKREKRKEERQQRREQRREGRP
ncbi:DUF748 domain-containing protein [Rudanella paleaurantiibacter]|uniref:DUF748 domain-containing protein n=1 Tax=Rudanella paleaurantiibacter TaxID=2614655 RepID=A0A7J5TYT3_9BACT|nr:DUF748 domain-containing protein [Rudanella paleaurantiibacter]KAB7729066.1 DUF748 domain-containing protein [Rudanella paleaurantiibacter]